MISAHTVLTPLLAAGMVTAMAATPVTHSEARRAPRVPHSETPVFRRAPWVAARPASDADFVVGEKPAPAAVTVTFLSDVPAVIRFDGVDLGLTPAESPELAAGHYRVKATTSDGKDSKVVGFTVEAGALGERTIEFDFAESEDDAAERSQRAGVRGPARLLEMATASRLF